MQRNGFTLIELLVVVVVIGILATIAIGGSRSAVEQTYGAVLKSDLRNLAVAEENYFVENDRYTRRRGDLEFSVSRDVILRLRGNQRGWVGPGRASGPPSHALLLRALPGPDPAPLSGHRRGCDRLLRALG